MNLPSKLVQNAVEQLSILPGIGRKSALRLVLYMLKKDVKLIKNDRFCRKPKRHDRAH